MHISNSQPNFENFFALFNQPVSFDINVNDLNNRLRVLQQQFHPDQLTNSDSTNAQKNSALINHAYNTLLNPDSRANYLLELTGQEININESISDLDFLSNAMLIRMRLDETSNPDELNALKLEVQPLLNHQSNRFNSAYAKRLWTDAIDATQKLKFLVKLIKDIDRSIDDAHQQSNDDDLYL